MIDQLLHVQHVDDLDDDPIQHRFGGFAHVVKTLLFSPAGFLLPPSHLPFDRFERTLGDPCGQDGSGELH
jgi:hypothetical protein